MIVIVEYINHEGVKIKLDFYKDMFIFLSYISVSGGWETCFLPGDVNNLLADAIHFSLYFAFSHISVDYGVDGKMAFLISGKMIAMSLT
ncbi:hypothetical protein QNN88_10050 [Citrobacter sp. ANG330]|uniref:hypothetical protein n=1 Tax=Citrobacter sp. ANG330 TaxID=3048142 RepID=UPI0039C279D8